MRCNGVEEDSNNLGNDWMAKVWTINCQLILQICPKNAWEIDPRTNEKPNNNSFLFPDSSNIRWLISGHSGQDRIEGGTWAQGRLQFRESILSGVIANHIGGHIRLFIGWLFWTATVIWHRRFAIAIHATEKLPRPRKRWQQHHHNLRRI